MKRKNLKKTYCMKGYKKNANEVVKIGEEEILTVAEVLDNQPDNNTILDFIHKHNLERVEVQESYSFL